MTTDPVRFEYKPRDAIRLRPPARVAGVVFSDVNVFSFFYKPKKKQLEEEEPGLDFILTLIEKVLGAPLIWCAGPLGR